MCASVTAVHTMSQTILEKELMLGMSKIKRTSLVECILVNIFTTITNPKKMVGLNLSVLQLKGTLLELN